ncbi:MAG: LysM peptidoglycan-binding domain-containing protein [Acidimicrobiales bacterium]
MRLTPAATAAFVAAGLFSTALQAPVGPVLATSCARPYEAVENDSWSRIADKVGVTMRALLDANDATMKTLILVGDTVCLPKGATYEKKSTEATGLRLPAPKKRYSRSQSAAIIRDVFPDRLEKKALALAKRESKLNAAAYSWCCVGLFQINWWAHKPWLKDMGVTKASQLLDAEVNARAALQMYKRSGGWSPWDL